MAKQLQLRRGTSAEHSTFTGANGEVTIDTDKDVVVVHDGATVGGFPSQKQLVSGTNIKTINDISLLGSGNIDVIQTISVTNIDELKDFVAPYNNYALNVLGYSEAGDGGGGVFYYDASSTEADNGGTIIEPTSGSGRWVRQYSGVVNVKWFGAKGDGVTDDTTSFSDALAISDVIYVPYTEASYLIDGLYLDFNQTVIGNGIIKTSANHLINLSYDYDIEKSDDLKIMFIEGNKHSWEELLDIKSRGYNTIMAYIWNVTTDVTLKNVAALGMNLLVHSPNGTLAADVTYDSYDSVIGYYIFDEPILNGISKVNQETKVSAYRAVTNKKLYIAESATVYSTGSLASDYDVILHDVYYADSYTTANTCIKQYLINLAVYKTSCPNAKIIPCVGLFNDSGFNKSETNTIKIAKELLKFSDNSFAVFTWDAGIIPGAYDGVRNIARYYQAAKQITIEASTYKKNRFDIVPIGNTFLGSSNSLVNKWVNTVDGATPGVRGTAKIVVWDVKNVGSTLGYRGQTFAGSGLFVNDTSTAGFSDTPSGACSYVLRWYNYLDGSSANIALGASKDAGYTKTLGTPLTVAHTASITGISYLSTEVSDMPILSVSKNGSVSFPYSWVTGIMVFSDIKELLY